MSAAFLGGMFALITVSASTAATKTIAKPMFNGNRLDWCVKWAENCGRPAADAYCRAQGFARSTNFAVDRHIGWQSPTRLIGTGATCDLNHCDGFRFITCLKRPAMTQSVIRNRDYGFRAPSNIRSVPRTQLAYNGPLTIVIPPIPAPRPGLREMRTRQAAIRTIEPQGGVSEVARPATKAEIVPIPEPKPVTIAKADPGPALEEVKDAAPAAQPEPVKPDEAKQTAAIEAPAPEPAAPAPAMTDGAASPSAPNVFEKPMYNGRRLAWCEQFDASCGRPAADAFCKTKGFQHATDFVQDAHIGDVSPTRSIGSGAVCDQVPCDGFKLIACTM